MALVATVGASTSNSYVTRAEADAYFQLGMHPNGLKWHELEDEVKDALLIRATRMIDNCPIYGAKYDTDLTSGVPDQALKFPRAVDYDDGTTFIPMGVKYATYEQAIWLASVGTSDNREEMQARGVTSVSVGDVSETYGSVRNTSDPAQRLCPETKNILITNCFITRAGRFV